MKPPGELSDEVGWVESAAPAPARAPFKLPTKAEAEEWWRVRVQKLAPTPSRTLHVQPALLTPKLTAREALEAARQVKPQTPRKEGE